MAAKGQSKHPYEPLECSRDRKQIRLLQLLGDRNSAKQIQCKTQRVFMDESPVYEALSYCWGASTKRCTIACDSVEKNVTENLLAALHQLRLPDKPRLLWIDAICINQDDNTEKADQFRMMRDIYQQAECVVVWLGEESEGIERVWPLVQRLTQSFKLQEQAGDKQDYWEMSKSARTKYRIPPSNDPGYRALSDFFDSPWCRRIWVVQELVVATKISFIRGHHTLPGSWTMAAVLYTLTMNINIQFPFRFVDNRLKIMLRERMDRGKLKLLSTLSMHRISEATNPRDKIFALCGISTDFGPEKIDIHINYNSTVEDVFIQVARAILLYHNDLRLLRVPAPLLKRTEILMPSWVPDWTVLDEDMTVWLEEYDENKQPKVQPGPPKWQAAKGSKASVSFDGNSLGIMGFIFDKIVEIGEIYKPEKGICHLEPHSSWMVLAGLKSNAVYLNGKNMLDAYYHTITIGCFFGKSGDGKSAFRQYHRLLKRLRWFRAMGLTSSTVIAGPLVRKLEISLSNHDVFLCLTVAQNRRLIKTETGYIGLAHGLVRVGDHVTICKGSEFPLVLRKKTEGTDWALIGDTYVSGIMNGETFEEQKCHLIRIT